MSGYQIKFFTIFWVLILLPLSGVLVSGQSVGRYLQFPPLTGYVRHAPFNLLIFGAGVIISLLVLLGIGCFICCCLSRKSDAKQRELPWWGWLGFVVVILSWILAWNRFPWFSFLQPYTFAPLWLGYILSVNGVTWKRSGTCLLTRNPRSFLLLFPVSSVFWWYFEWLNRFVQNWYYVGVDDFSALAYILHATLCFSTVLPAVTATSEFLSTFFDNRESRCFKSVFRFEYGTREGWLLLALMGAILMALPLAPDQLFPFVWIAPLLIIVGMQGIVGRQTIFASLFRGNWRPVLLSAMAALICGFFWEMWNWKSLAHWEYSIPYVDRYHIFAMPILGYLGYLPFGLQCQVIATNVVDFSLHHTSAR
jgi:hypothetical protein